MSFIEESLDSRPDVLSETVKSDGKTAVDSQDIEMTDLANETTNDPNTASNTVADNVPEIVENAEITDPSTTNGTTINVNVADLISGANSTNEPSKPSNDPSISIAPGTLGSTNTAATPGTLTTNDNGTAQSLSARTPTPSAAGENTPVKRQNNTSSKRIDIDSIMTKFQKGLGRNWGRYRTTITQFLIGRLTRPELQHELSQILDPDMTYMHNHFLLATMNNALREAPQGEADLLTGWSTKHRERSRNVKGDSQLAKLKKDVMGLSVRERRRIKAIAKESAKRAPIPSTITATRQAMLPKIPFINDREKQQSNQQQQENGSTTEEPAKPLGTPATWTQSIIHSYDAPLASEAYEIPDNDSLMTRMLGISLEHGLLQGVNPESSEVMLTGLEFYMKDIIQQMFAKAKHRSQEHDKMTKEDLASVLESAPNIFVENNGPLFRLRDVLLQDEDEPSATSASKQVNGKAFKENERGKAIDDRMVVKSFIQELIANS